MWKDDPGWIRLFSTSEHLSLGIWDDTSIWSDGGGDDIFSDWPPTAPQKSAHAPGRPPWPAPVLARPPSPAPWSSPPWPAHPTLRPGPFLPVLARPSRPGPPMYPLVLGWFPLSCTGRHPCILWCSDDVHFPFSGRQSRCNGSIHDRLGLLEYMSS